MRRRTLLLAALISFSGLAACGGGSDPSDTSAAAGSAAASSGVDIKESRTRVTRAAKDGAGSTSTDSGTVAGSDGSTGATGTAAPAALLASPPTGRLLASNCFACHGTNGRPAAGFDKLAGESAAGIYNDLKEMAVKTDKGIMGVHARGYTDTQLWQLATYFSQQR